jgi:hypothetical protein
MRGFVPAQASATDRESVHSVARQLQAEHCDYEIESLKVQATVDWDGNVRIVRTFEGCRPNATGRAVWQMSFRERIVGVDPNPEAASYPKFAVRQAPPDLEHEISTSSVGHWRCHRIFFPKGWRRLPHKLEDSFSFAFESYQEKALLLDPSEALKRAAVEALSHPLRGSLNFLVPYFVKRLEVSLDFPRGYEPERWDAWVWWGSEQLENVGRNLSGKGVSRTLELRSSGGHAELSADEPLAGYTFALVWTPADRQKYLEARYGGPNEQPHPDPAAPRRGRPPHPRDQQGNLRDR